MFLRIGETYWCTYWSGLLTGVYVHFSHYFGEAKMVGEFAAKLRQDSGKKESKICNEVLAVFTRI